MADLFDLAPDEGPADPEDRIIATLNKKQMKAWTVLLQHERGLTNWEVETLCGAHNSTWRTRVSELVKKKLVVDSGRSKRIPDSDDADRYRTIWICKRYYDEERRREKEVEARVEEAAPPPIQAQPVAPRCHCGEWAQWNFKGEHRCYEHRDEIGFDFEGKWRNEH